MRARRSGRGWQARVASVGSAAHAVRLDPAHRDAQHHEQDQRHRQADAPGQRTDRAAGTAVLDHHEIQARAEVVEDGEQSGDDDDFSEHDPIPDTFSTRTFYPRGYGGHRSVAAEKTISAP